MPELYLFLSKYIRRDYRAFRSREKLGDNIKTMASLPLKPIKKIIKKYHHGDISQETTIAFRDAIIEFIDILAKQTVQEFNAINESRNVQGLPSLKRLDKISFKNAWEKILKQLDDKKTIGEVGKSNKILLYQDGAN